MRLKIGRQKLKGALFLLTRLNPSSCVPVYPCKDLVQGIEFDHLLNCIWRPEEELNEAILLVSSSAMAVYENDNLGKFCQTKSREFSSIIFKTDQ